jgi:hypothetical protein
LENKTNYFFYLLSCVGFTDPFISWYVTCGLVRMSTDFKNLLKRSFETVTLNHCHRIPPLGITGFKFKECELEVSRIEPLHNANCVVEYLSRNLLTALMHQSMIRSFVESLFCCCDRPLRFLSLLIHLCLYIVLSFVRDPFHRLIYLFFHVNTLVW